MGAGELLIELPSQANAPALPNAAPNTARVVVNNASGRSQMFMKEAYRRGPPRAGGETAVTAWALLEVPMRKFTALLVSVVVVVLAGCPDAIAEGKAKMNSERDKNAQPAPPPAE